MLGMVQQVAKPEVEVASKCAGYRSPEEHCFNKDVSWDLVLEDSALGKLFNRDQNMSLVAKDRECGTKELLLVWTRDRRGLYPQHIMTKLCPCCTALGTSRSILADPIKVTCA
mmetsp:Transcript_30978/g.70825  ORF Transcript_30978/g.70825 Transcript_30978/m.70825 type:complete len:113 (-) Transcript_30978:797-1135(-)